MAGTMPMIGNSSLGGALPSSASANLSSGLVGGIQGMAGGGRLAPSISADPLMLGGPPHPGPANLQAALQSTLSTHSVPPDMEG
jgi:hypothetical protein